MSLQFSDDIEEVRITRIVNLKEGVELFVKRCKLKHFYQEKTIIKKRATKDRALPFGEKV